MSSLAIVFPGQGSQSVGMLSDIAAEFPSVQSVFAEASDALGYDLWELSHSGPAEKLDSTVHTQPALLAASYAIWQLLANDLKPAILAGHSLGEYTALVCAEALSFTDGIKLVAARGAFMQDACPTGLGALAAIVGLSDEEVSALCDQVRQNDVLSPANFNSPGQVVIAGHADAVDRAVQNAKAAGAKLAKRLAVSVPSHCALMKPAADRLAQQLAQITIQTPVLPVLNNVDAKLYETPESIRDGLTRQLFMPVRWVETIQAFAKQGIKQIIECGPGKVLTGLNKRIAPEIELQYTADIDQLRGVLHVRN